MGRAQGQTLASARAPGLRSQDSADFIEGADGSREKRVDGLLHCEDGPARILLDGTEEWYFEGQRMDAATVRAAVWHKGARAYRNGVRDGMITPPQPKRGGLIITSSEAPRLILHTDTIKQMARLDQKAEAEGLTTYEYEQKYGDAAYRD